MMDCNIDCVNLASTLSLSLIIRGASALVDGNIIHIDAENIPVNTDKTIEIVFAGKSRELTKYLVCVFSSDYYYHSTHLRSISLLL